MNMQERLILGEPVNSLIGYCSPIKKVFESGDMDGWLEGLIKRANAVEAAWEQVTENAINFKSEARVIPAGWRFYSADFSCDDRNGHITLKRDKAGTLRWLALSEAEREATDLHIMGVGANVNDAVLDAIRKIPKEQA